MSIETIREALTNLSYDKSWKCVLVRYKHKTHPNEFISYDFSFLRHAELSALLKDICDATMAIIDKNHCTVQDYTLSNAKNVIEKLSLKSQDIKTAWTAFSNSVDFSFLAGGCIILLLVIVGIIFKAQKPEEDEDLKAVIERIEHGE